MPPAPHSVVLVVDDQPEPLQLMANLLMRAGYLVATAEGGRAALNALTDLGAAVALVITDVMMPVVDGRAVAQMASRIAPGVHVIFASGLDKERLVTLGRVPPDAAFLAKPYTQRELLSFVRLLIGDAPSTHAQCG